MKGLITPVPVTGSTLTSSTGDVVVFDADLELTFTDTATVSKHPREEGSDFTDDVRIKPVTGTLRAVVTNLPLHIEYTEIVKARPKKAYEQLLGMVGDRCVLVSPERTIEDFVLLSVSKPLMRDKAVFTMQFEQVFTVSPEYSKVDPAELADQVRDSGQSEEERGSQEEEGTEEREERVRSWAASMADTVLGAFQ